MNTGQICKGKKGNNFTMLPNEVLKSKDLSLEEKGLLAYLLSLPDDWVLYKTLLSEVLNETEYKISKAFKGLQKAGYIVSVKVIDTASGKFVGWNHAVYDDPVIENTDNQPRHEITKVVKTDIRQNAPILNTNNTTNIDVPQKKPKHIGTKIYFKDSEFFDKAKFAAAFPDWPKSKLKFYYDKALVWSNEGNKKIDWKATVRSWANTDELTGKYKFSQDNNLGHKFATLS